jgi:hypothetical protein
VIALALKGGTDEAALLLRLEFQNHWRFSKALDQNSSVNRRKSTLIQEQVLACALVMEGHVNTGQVHRDRASVFQGVRNVCGHLELERSWADSTRLSVIRRKGPPVSRFGVGTGVESFTELRPR